MAASFRPIAPHATIRKRGGYPAAQLVILRGRLFRPREQIIDTKYAEAVQATALEFMDKEKTKFEWAPYELVYDSPDKGIKSKAGPSVAITPKLVEALKSAEKELIVLSPYFVPRKEGTEIFSELQARGVDVTIVEADGRKLPQIRRPAGIDSIDNNAAGAFWFVFH